MVTLTVLLIADSKDSVVSVTLDSLEAADYLCEASVCEGQNWGGRGGANAP